MINGVSFRLCYFIGLIVGTIPCLSAGLEIGGKPQQGGLLFGSVVQGDSVRYQGKKIQLTDSGRFIIGLDRDAPAQIELQVIALDGSAVTHEVAIAQREYQIQRIEGVARQYVAPDPAQVSRSRQEAVKVGAARRQKRKQTDFFSGFIWPANGPITGVFGSQRVYNGEPRRPHYGVDVAGPVGALAVAPAGGLVTLAESDLFFSGGTLIIDHGHSLSSTFLHLSKLLVKVGDRVVQGQKVAEIGATGRVTGPHLDWRMNWLGAKGNARIDPQLLVPEMKLITLSSNE